MAAPVTVAVLAEAPGPDCLPGLAPLLGPGARRRLLLALIERAARCAAAAAPGRALLAVDGELESLPAGVERVADPPAAAEPGCPLVLVTAACPRLGHAHLAAACDDLAAGARTVLGPALDGGAYLIASAPPVPRALPRGPDGVPRLLQAAGARDGELGLLRHERVLAAPDDAWAFLADPLLAPELRALLAGR